MGREHHGGNNSRLYMAWCNMKGRCYRPSMKGYHNYGGRGIEVCDEWRDSFIAFRKWALENGYKEDAKRGELTLDRIDVNGDYCPENCRWISNKEQQNNRQYNRLITYNGETKTLAQWSEQFDMCYKTLQKRIEKWGVDKAFTQKILTREEVRGTRYKRARAVSQYDFSGNLIKEWDCISSACEQNGYFSSSISACCKRKALQAHGYVWRYAGEPFDSDFRNRIKAVVQYSRDGKEVARFSGFREVKEKTGINENSLRTSCYQSGGNYKGYIWKIERYGDAT